GIRVVHEQLCACPRRFGGDPYRHCLKRCETDYECEDSEICHHNLCSNACLPSLKKCSYKQKCEVKNHTVDCLNEPSEYKSCETSGDCDEKSYCAGGQSLCIPLCDPQTCADNEFCHEKTFFSSEQFTLRGISCKCDANPILVHGSRKCHKLDDQSCYDNSACDDSEFCNEGKCVNGCYNVSCHQNEVCQISNHISSCECVHNFARNDKRECKKGCITDNECDDSDTCYKNLCTNACDPSITPCAYLNKCEVKNHFSNCTDEIIDTYKHYINCKLCNNINYSVIACENHSDCDADLYCHPHASDASASVHTKM
ncbi:hypothetical protein PV326_007716, partial [Microctonus aethiopoides]